MATKTEKMKYVEALSKGAKMVKVSSIDDIKKYFDSINIYLSTGDFVGTGAHFPISRVIKNQEKEESENFTYLYCDYLDYTKILGEVAENVTTTLSNMVKNLVNTFSVKTGPLYSEFFYICHWDNVLKTYVPDSTREAYYMNKHLVDPLGSGSEEEKMKAAFKTFYDFMYNYYNSIEKNTGSSADIPFYEFFTTIETKATTSYSGGYTGGYYTGGTTTYTTYSVIDPKQAEYKTALYDAIQAESNVSWNSTRSKLLIESPISSILKDYTDGLKGLLKLLKTFYESVVVPTDDDSHCVSGKWAFDSSIVKASKKFDANNASSVTLLFFKVISWFETTIAKDWNTLVLINYFISYYFDFEPIVEIEGALEPDATPTIDIAGGYFTGDRRIHMRAQGALNTFYLTSYNWGMNASGSLQELGLNSYDFPYVRLYEFQPDYVQAKTDRISAAAKAIGFDINTIATGDSALEKGLTAIAEWVSKDIDTENQSTEDWTSVSEFNNLVSGNYVGIYDIPFFCDDFIKAATSSGWTMGNAISKNEVLQNRFNINVQDIPTWKFTGGEGLNWENTFYLINSDISSLQANYAFLFSFASSAFWGQAQDYKFRPPNLFRVEAPGRFFCLYAAFDIEVRYVGKVRHYLNDDLIQIFGESYIYNRIVKGDCYIPEAFSVKTKLRDVTPQCYNIYANYMLAGGKDGDGYGLVPNITSKGGSTEVKFSKSQLI